MASDVTGTAKEKIGSSVVECPPLASRYSEAATLCQAALADGSGSCLDARRLVV